MNFKVIGIDDSQDPEFSTEVRELIASEKIFSGGKRHHELVKAFLPEGSHWIDIVVPLQAVFQQYQAHKSIVVFASGDPLFFGFANTILRMEPEAKIKLYPSFNSLQLLAHRLIMPYHDMHIVSLTGRPWPKFDEALIYGYDKIGILTDNKLHTPSNIAERMLRFGFDNYKMHIGSLLGNKQEERIVTLPIEEVLNQKFAFPNNIIIEKTAARPRPFGIPETDFELLNNRAKMITKMPIRLLSIAMLELRDKAIFWDIGFCTGSVSIEAKLQFPHLEIYAFEKREEGSSLIENNSKKFGAPGIHSFIGDFTETDITALPHPQAIFIGGHGGKMSEIVGKLCKVLDKDGVIVFNSVSENSRQLFMDAIEQNNLMLDRSTTIKIDDFNTIDVMRARFVEKPNP